MSAKTQEKRPIKGREIMRKTFVIGDIHGCFQEFLNLLEKINYNKQDIRLILTGDLINRGPRSLDALEWVRREAAETVKGNHEHAFAEAVLKGRPLSPSLNRLKEEMGGRAEEWARRLRALPLYIEERDFIVVHAGLVPGEPPGKSRPELLMTIRTWDGKGEDVNNKSCPPWHSFYKKKKLVIYGHWAEQGLRVSENTIGLDSGCVYGGRLSGVFLPERRIVQTPALKNYTV